MSTSLHSHPSWTDPRLLTQWEDLIAHPRYTGATRQPCTLWFGGRRGGGITGTLVTLPRVTLPLGWSETETDILIHFPSWFPSQPPDHFWTPSDLRYTNPEGWANCLPQRTIRFVKSHVITDPPGLLDGFTCWMYRPTQHSGFSDTLLTYAHFMRLRFDKLR